VEDYCEKLEMKTIIQLLAALFCAVIIILPFGLLAWKDRHAPRQ
jgi:succinate dehydrogenase hydrophobic anchor subunit